MMKTTFHWRWLLRTNKRMSLFLLLLLPLTLVSNQLPVKEVNESLLHLLHPKRRRLRLQTLQHHHHHPHLLSLLTCLSRRAATVVMLSATTTIFSTKAYPVKWQPWETSCQWFPLLPLHLSPNFPVEHLPHHHLSHNHLLLQSLLLHLQPSLLLH